MRKNSGSTAEEKEPCVICWKCTQYKKSTPISQRENYIQGLGQVCKKCATEVGKNKSSAG